MDEFSEEVRAEAAKWFTRMRDLHDAGDEQELAVWRNKHPDNDAAYCQLLMNWDRSRFGAGLDRVKGRDLGRAAVWYRQPALRAGAAAVLVLALLLGAYAVVHRPAGTIALAYGSPPGTIRSFALPDGTRIVLDADSNVRIAFSERERRVDLIRGRVRIDIAAKAVPPFTVLASDAQIAASDSAFDVDLAPHGVHVAILRGKAEARGPQGAAGQPATLWRLDGGQQIEISANAAPRAAPTDTFLWPSGMLSFDQERLDDAIAVVNRYNRRKLRLDDPSSGARRITGAFHARDPEGFAKAVAAMFAMMVVTDRDGTLVLRPFSEKKSP